MAMFDRLNAQQQPFIQSGYGAMGKLNTLLGIGGQRPLPAPTGEVPLGGNATLMPRTGIPQGPYRPGPGGGIRMQPSVGQAAPQDLRLQQILQLRAANGDTEAQRMLGNV